MSLIRRVIRTSGNDAALHRIAYSDGMFAGHGGHGAGRTMHAGPSVPSDGRPGRGIKLTEGLAIAVEPMPIPGSKDGYVHDNGGSLHPASGRRAAHSEHPVAVTADGPVILTLP